MIYIVDDDASVRTSLARLLRAAGHEVQAFASADACRDAVFADGSEVRCLILDVHMTGLRPLDLQEEIYHRIPSLPVIILSATDDAESRVIAMAAGITKVLRKPFDPTALLQAIADAIGRTAPPPPPPPSAGPTRPQTPTNAATPPGEAAGWQEAGRGDPLHFTVEGVRGLYRPAGAVSFEEAVALVRAAIAAARRRRLEDLLVDTTALTGFPSPDIFNRFLAVVEWAEEARSGLRLVVVARAELINPQKFGVLVAGNRGLISNIFPTEAEARAWLDGLGIHGP